jgi:hypothetical protein
VKLDPIAGRFALQNGGTHLSRAQTSADQSMEQKQKSGCLPSDMAINSPAEKKQFAC